MGRKDEGEGRGVGCGDKGGSEKMGVRRIPRRDDGIGPEGVWHPDETDIYVLTYRNLLEV